MCSIVVVIFSKHQCIELHFNIVYRKRYKKNEVRERKAFEYPFICCRIFCCVCRIFFSVYFIAFSGVFIYFISREGLILCDKILVEILFIYLFY